MPTSDAGSNLGNTMAPMQGSGGLQKEVEIGDLRSREIGLVDVGVQEIELPKEVVSAGVKAQSTTVQLPANVQNLGVQTVGQSGPVTQVTTVVLPLTDDQIAVGLHQGVTSSFRWLAEWCVRRLKQMHVGVKNIHGKLFRVKYA